MTLQHDPERQLFEFDTPHGIAYVSYAIRPGNVFDITYTFTPPPARGDGLASRMVREVEAWARREGYAVTASCGFAARVIAA